MEAVFVCKVFKNATTWLDNREYGRQIQFVYIDKFALCAFNWLVYDQVINSLFAANFFLKLTNYYIPQYFIKRIKLNISYFKIVLLFFLGKANKDFSDELVSLDKSKSFLLNMSDNY